jgi:alkyl hydroperoxide reductase subunit AhpF
MSEDGQHGAAPTDGETVEHAAAVVPLTGAGGAGSGAIAGSLSDLRARRAQLAERVAGLTWDLGGLAYEMAIRDHYRLDVLARKAAELQQADAQLAELQRLLAGAESGVQGQCRSCGAVHSRGAAYCWHCGAPLLKESRPSVLVGEQHAG